MARQFVGRLTRDALRARVAESTTTTTTSADAIVAEPGTDLALVVDWLTRLHLLHGVPFNYLVPDIGMLPAESIRFFQVDDDWIAALLDGAYAIGFAGVSQAAALQGRAPVLGAAAARARAGVHRQALLAQATPRTAAGIAARIAARRARVDAAVPAAPPPITVTPEPITGFLLRSSVVAGWPGMEAHAFADVAGTQPIPLVRMERLAPSLLLALFGGVLARVDLQEASEGVHFGVDPNGGAWQKQLRYANGDDTTSAGSYISGGIVPVTPRGSGTPTIIPHDTLAQSMSTLVWTAPPPTDTTFTAAQYGLEMVEGVQAVSFQLQGS